MRAAEEAAFARGITAEALMDEAAAGIARTVAQFFPAPGRCLVFAGKGNNAGDAIAAAALLQERDWSIDLRPTFPEAECSELAQKKLRCFQHRAESTSAGGTIILDGLLGLGAKPPLRGPIAEAAREINRLRRDENAFVFAVDLPTGLEGDSGEADADCVTADCTITIGLAKAGLLADRALNHVGRIARVPLPALSIASGDEPEAILAEEYSLRGLLPRRAFDAYKNQFGRIGIVAGSVGLSGAAILTAHGALRGGAGLVQLFVREEIYPIVASAAPPEVMVKPVVEYAALLDEPIDVWALGPGLGLQYAQPIRRLIQELPAPMVVDADALNILARDLKILRQCGGPRLLTPHPGEMKRLFPLEKASRAEHARQFCDAYRVALLFKGSRTIVAEQGQPLSYNTAGHPGMATGGMGDILTGICAALIGQKLAPYDAARLGAWLCGRAAEIALFENHASSESLLPSDVLANLGRAFGELR